MEPRELPIRLCLIADLPDRAARGFSIDGTGEDTLFVVRQGQQVRAFRDRCPHQGAPLEYRKDAFMSVDGEHIVCFAHGASFDPDSGLCLRGPCAGESLQQLPCFVADEYVWLGVLPAR